MLIEVDPQSLHGVSRRLLQSAQAAHEVKEGSRALKDLADRAGHPELRSAIHSFLDRWSYGCGCLLEDARQVADRLEKTSKVYVETETRISGAFSRGR